MSLSMNVGKSKLLILQYSAVRFFVASSVTRAAEMTFMPSACPLSQALSFGSDALQCGQSTDQKMSTLTLSGASIEDKLRGVVSLMSGASKSGHFLPTSSVTG